MRKLMVLLGMSLLLLVLACSANDGFSEDVLASKAAAGQDDGGFSRLVEQASAAPMAAAMEAAPPGRREHLPPICRYWSRQSRNHHKVLPGTWTSPNEKPYPRRS